MAAKKQPRRSVVRDENYTPMEQYAIALNEWYKALRKAGFDRDMAFWFLSDKASYPDWLMPPIPNEMKPIPYEDEDDED